MMSVLSNILSHFSNNFPEVYDFVVQNPNFYDQTIFHSLYLSLFKLALCVGHVLQALSVTVYYLTLIALKLTFLSFPHILKLGNAIAEFHRTQLSVWDMVVEAILILTISTILIFRKRIALAWERLENNISKKSRVAARVAPHVLFFTSAALLAYFGNKFLLPFASARVLPVFTIIIPLVRTVSALRLEQSDRYRDLLVTWIVLSMYYALCFLAASIPFSSALLRIMPMLREFTLLVSLWVQASPVCAHLVFEAANPIIQFYVNKIPAADISSSTQGIFAALRFMGVGKTILTTVQGLLDDGVAVLLSLAFMFTPFPIANIGVVIVALLLPAFKGSKLVGWGKYTASKKKGEPKGDVSALTSSLSLWLQYWLCLALLLLMREYSVAKLYPSAMMALTLWLQNSHFQGSKTAISHVVGFVRELSAYERAQQEKRKAAALIAAGSASSEEDVAHGCPNILVDSAANTTESSAETDKDRGCQVEAAEGDEDSGSVGAPISKPVTGAAVREGGYGESDHLAATDMDTKSVVKSRTPRKSGKKASAIETPGS